MTAENQNYLFFSGVQQKRKKSLDSKHQTLSHSGYLSCRKRLEQMVASQTEMEERYKSRKLSGRGEERTA